MKGDRDDIIVRISLSDLFPGDLTPKFIWERDHLHQCRIQNTCYLQIKLFLLQRKFYRCQRNPGRKLSRERGMGAYWKCFKACRKFYILADLASASIYTSPSPKLPVPQRVTSSCKKDFQPGKHLTFECIGIKLLQESGFLNSTLIII